MRFMSDKTIWERFAAHLRSQDRAAITVSGYLRDLQAFARWFEQTNGDALSLEQITPTDAREYRQWLIARQAAPSSVNRRLSALRAFFEWAQGQALDVRGVEEQSLAPRWLDRREQSALLREAERALSAARSEAARLLARRAGVEGVTLHTLRHTFAKNLVDAGVGLERVAALLGHNNLNTTRIYTLPGERDLERAVERLE
jgi:site-specific recombinase XerD